MSTRRAQFSVEFLIFTIAMIVVAYPAVWFLSLLFPVLTRLAGEGFSDEDGMFQGCFALFIYVVPVLALSLYAIETWTDRFLAVLLSRRENAPDLPRGVKLLHTATRLHIQMPPDTPPAMSHIVVFMLSFPMFLVAAVIHDLPLALPNWLALLVPIAILVGAAVAFRRRLRRRIERGDFEMIIDRQAQTLKSAPTATEKRTTPQPLGDFRTLTVRQHEELDGEGTSTFYAVELQRDAQTPLLLHDFRSDQSADRFAALIHDETGIVRV